jgi:hypothetical protein
VTGLPWLKRLIFIVLPFFLLYLPFFIALAGRRDKRWKGLALALCIAAMA